MLKFVPFLVLIWILLGLAKDNKHESNVEPIRYINDQTINLPIVKIESRIIPSADEDMPEDTLFQHLSAGDIPVFYSQNVETGVCFDNKCRLLVITLYWNPNGRYLGFVLPEKEFLSKKDHDPFTKSEYERLNGLLADPNLPLGRISYNELVLASKPVVKSWDVDGISGATSQDMLAYVIEGAAYTTHKLYAILYGPTQKAVKDWTLEKLNEDFIQKYLSSPMASDVLWGLESLQGKLQNFPNLKDQIFAMMVSENFSFSEKAISVFTSKDLNNPETQMKILSLFSSFDVGRKRTILELFRGETVLLPQAVSFLNSELPKLEIPLIVQVMEIYKSKGVKDSETHHIVSSLASSSNSYLALKAKDYLNWAN